MPTVAELRAAAARRAAQPPASAPARSGSLLAAVQEKKAREADAAQQHRAEFHSGGDTVCLVCPPESYVVYHDGPEPTEMEARLGIHPDWEPALTVAGTPGRELAVHHDGAMQPSAERNDYYDELRNAELAVQRIKAARGVPGDRWHTELPAAWGRDLPPGPPGRGRGPMRQIIVEFSDGRGDTYVRGFLVRTEHARHAGLVVAELARRNHWTILNLHKVQTATP